MFTNTRALARACALRRELLFKDIIKKQISTSSTPNSNAFSNKKNNSFKSNGSKWSKLNSYNNQRALSTSQTHLTAQAVATTLVSKEENREFMAVFPDIIRHLTDADKNSDIPEVCEWYARVLQQNVPDGAKIRGHAVVAAYKMLEDPNKLTPENIRLAYILGWCVEMLQAYFITVDDAIDGSERRRGTPCWYKRVGLIAMNDSQLIENSIFTLLKDYFSNLPIYLPAVELIHDATQKTCMGQTFDALCLKDGRPNLETFTMKRYNSTVKYKNYYYSFHLPIALGMILANKLDPEMHRQASTVLLELAQFFQIQDDFLDCFGDPEKIGKIGTDIQDGKCSWLAVVALQRATPSQKKFIEENYGKEDPVAIAAIKNLYEDLGLPNTYAIYKEDTYNLIKTHIQQLTKELPHALFFKYLDEFNSREC